MLTRYALQSSASVPGQTAATAATKNDGAWIDLVDPSDDELRHAETILGAKLPVRDEVSAIELSSRFSSKDDILRLNIPGFVRDEGGQGAMTPLGLVLTPSLLISLRYADSVSFEQLVKIIDKETTSHTSVSLFVTLIETIVNDGADRMEAIAGELSKLSRAVFADKREHQSLLRNALFKVGRMQRTITQIRSAMLGVSRVVHYLCDEAPAWFGDASHVRLKTVSADIGSLAEYDQQLSDRLQFLLDAVLGFINNDQNDIMKVLTIVSVVTIPPMILAGIWGMNFKSIGEYDWPHGYAFALTIMTISVVVPLIIFKWKKWF